MINILKKISFKIYSSIPFKRIKPSVDPIDVIIPVIKKDLGILPLCLEGIRESVTNTINEIYIISPDDNEIKNFCVKFNLNFIDEKEVLGYSPKELNLKNRERAGWIYQQLLKLSGNYGSCRHYLCIDADHILIQPHTFLAENGNNVFYKSLEQRKSVYKNIKKIIGIELNIYSRFGFISHKMIFDKFEIDKLKGTISFKNFNKSWDKSIITSLDERDDVSFSEFELYGNFVKEKFAFSRPWNNINLKYSELANYEDLKIRYSKKYKAITFSAWAN
jgi:hypothetical protein